MYMEMNIKKADITQVKAGVAVMYVYSDEKELLGPVKVFDELLQGALAKAIKEEKYAGKENSVFLMRTANDMTVSRVMLVGLGKKSSVKLETVRQASATALRAVRGLKIKNAVSVVPEVSSESLSVVDSAQALTEGVLLAGYSFDTYKKKPEKVYLKRFDLVTTDGRDVRRIQKGITLGELMARGTNMARDLVNTPGQDMVPITLVEHAREIGKGNPLVRVRVYSKTQLERMGAGALLGVAKGSIHEPYMVHMIYTPIKKTKKRVALVGKAVTFDSGGLSLKPSSAMESMKVDMAGSAAVLGAFSVISEVAPSVEVHGIFGAAENMLSAQAVRPGDVLTSMSKKTIEVLNTDAEGRLTLADTLTYALKQKPDVVIDLATLTGACVVALGEEISAVLSNNNELSLKVLRAAEDVGEKMWPMPLEKSYKKLLKSDVADIKNIAGRWGGALTAGLFLEEFVDKTPWAHIDIAGPAFAERPIDPYTGKGATGHAVRTLLQFLRNY
jgi:leucyl aminopeptidase